MNSPDKSNTTETTSKLDNPLESGSQNPLVTRFWVSWVQRSDDYRPLGYPPHEPVLGWWCSGYDSADNATLCALIEAADEKAAEEVIKKEWPEWTEWRFIEPRENDHRPGDRFPLSDWMEARINSQNAIGLTSANPNQKNNEQS